MTEPYIGEIRCFGFNFAPRGYAFCNGQTMSIAQYTALYSIIGTIYGGDGQTTFLLPNLQGQIPMHWGNPPSNFNTVIGEVQGQPNVTLTVSQMPQHNHMIMGATASVVAERSASPTISSFLSSAKGALVYQKPPVTANAPFSPRAISASGMSIPHDNMQPYLTLNFCIALEGIFPPHS